MVSIIVTVALYNLKIWSQTDCFWQGFGTGGGLVGVLVGASQIITLLQSLYVSQTVRSLLYNAFVTFFTGIVSLGVGALAPSSTVQECLGR